MKTAALILLILFLTCGCASIEQRREIAELDKIYKEGRISISEYWRYKTEILNKRNASNLNFKYQVGK